MQLNVNKNELPAAHEYLRCLIFGRPQADDAERRRFVILRGCSKLNCTSSSGQFFTTKITFATCLAVSIGFSN